MIEKNKIILTAETNFHDEELRELFIKLSTKVDTINQRTKLHTLDIRELKKVKK